MSAQPTPLAVPETAALIRRVVGQVNRIILGKDHQVRLCLACLLARGHLLIEDVPGVGKTTLAHALARSLGLTYQRIQFTSDMLPADIIGASIWDKHDGEFRFHAGPVFAQIVLADEVNRATPKTQSALLEAMEEHQVTVDGATRRLPEPFFVIATQNPLHQIGTFPLPESQLDRFLMRIELGFPGEEAERALLKGEDRRRMLETLEPVMTHADLEHLQARVNEVHASDALLDYLQAIVRHTREAPEFEAGLSPRAALALLHASKAWALTEGRNVTLPEDVQAVLGGVVRHRLRVRSDRGTHASIDVAQRIKNAVAIP
jgi:MoxR-like ATPase